MNFVPAVTKLLAELKQRGYITATDPYYGGTSRDYARIPLDNVDYINMQMYAKNIQDFDRLVFETESSINEYSQQLRAEARRKFIFGVNSVNHHPDPNVGSCGS